MTWRNDSADAVGYFAQNAERFHDLYKQTAEFQSRLRLWYALLERYAVRDGLAVDMGCGSGVLTFHLAELGTRAVGIDGAAEMVALCDSERQRRGTANVAFHQFVLPNVDEHLVSNADLLISSSVLEYVQDLDASLNLFSRLLKPSGTLIVSMPNRTSLSRTYQRIRFKMTGQPEVYRFIRHFSSPAALDRKLRSRGMHLLEAHYYTHFTRLARVTRSVKLPSALTEDLFVGVYRKVAASAR